jgi:signal transduction histidine kinase/CheY-like chemotaxis protein
MDRGSPEAAGAAGRDRLEARYRKIFETAGVGLWEEDYSAVKKELDALTALGVTDFRAYFAARPDEISRIAGLIRVLDANSRALAAHGARSLEELGGSLARITAPAALPLFGEALAAIAEGRDHFEAEVPGLTLAGEPVHTLISVAIPREESEFRRLTVSTLDISERKKTELALKESEDRYRSIFNNARVSLWEEDFTAVYDLLAELRGRVTDVAGYLAQNPQWVRDCLSRVRVLDVNAEALRLYAARRKEELIGSLQHFVGEQNLPVFAQELAAIAEGRQSFEGEQETTRLNGEPMTVLVSFAVPRDREGFRRVIVSIMDITQTRRAEEEGLRVQRLESLGVLAGGIAHDFNNILTAILGNLSLLHMEMEQAGGADSGQEGLIRDAEKAVIRAKGLTQQLLTFSQGGAPVKRLVSLRALLRDTVSFALSGSAVEADFTIPEDLYDAEVDDGQIGQAVNNIVLNSRQAMQNGGRLEISASNRDGPRGEPGVVMVFTDHGTGIPTTHLPRIFDPYFTTKAGGKGLGLAVAHSVVRKHNGRITVRSEPGKGTTFTIELPASRQRAAVAPPAKPAGLAPLHVLVMDDEAAVRTIAGRLLERLGCTVSFAAGGEEAIFLCEELRVKGRPVDVVIMDLTIPGGMGGGEAVARLRALGIPLKAVASSGYANDPILSSYRESGFDAVLAKPYTLEEVHSVLSRLQGG